MEIIHLKTDLAICSHTLRTRHRVSRALGITPRRGGLSPTCAPPPDFHFLYLFLRCQLSNQDCDWLCGSQLCFRRVSFRTAATILVLQSLKHSPWKRTATCCERWNRRRSLCGLLWSPACVCLCWCGQSFAACNYISLTWTWKLFPSVAIKILNLFELQHKRTNSVCTRDMSQPSPAPGAEGNSSYNVGCGRGAIGMAYLYIYTYNI